MEVFVTEAKAGVGVGHSIGYPFGVLFLILGINVIPKIFGFDVEEEKKKYFAQKAIDIKNNEKLAASTMPEVPMDFVGFSLAAFLGYVLGSIKIYMGPWGCSPWVPPAVPSWFPWVWVPSGRWGL